MLGNYLQYSSLILLYYLSAYITDQALPLTLINTSARGSCWILTSKKSLPLPAALGCSITPGDVKKKQAFAPRSSISFTCKKINTQVCYHVEHMVGHGLYTN